MRIAAVLNAYARSLALLCNVAGDFHFIFILLTE
jgi:hypothetical protein